MNAGRDLLHCDIGVQRKVRNLGHSNLKVKLFVYGALDIQLGSQCYYVTAWFNNVCYGHASL